MWRCRRFRFGCRDPVCSDRVAVGGTADLHGVTDREPLRVLDGLLLSNCVWGVVVSVYAVPLLALTVRVGPFSAVIVPLTPRACRPYPPRWCCRRDAPNPATGVDNNATGSNAPASYQIHKAGCINHHLISAHHHRRRAVRHPNAGAHALSAGPWLTLAVSVITDGVGGRRLPAHAQCPASRQPMGSGGPPDRAPRLLG